MPLPLGQATILKINVMTMEEYENFLNGNLKSHEKACFIINKKLIKKLTKFINCGKEPDYCVLIILEKKAFIIELKDGDTFDTKKVSGEIASLKEFANKFKLKFPDFDVFPKFCSFNATEKKKIIYGVKNKITEEMAMNGEEFCLLLGISYQNIINQRKNFAPTNLKYFVQELIKIPAIKDLI
jgi:hypothetical protein